MSVHQGESVQGMHKHAQGGCVHGESVYRDCMSVHRMCVYVHKENA